MRVLCIDPGSVKSGWVVMDHGKRVLAHGWDLNETILNHYLYEKRADYQDFDTLVIEDVTHMGMAVGRDVFETVRWSGRFDADRTAVFIDRKQVKLNLCGNPRAKDPNIRQAIIDRYGGDSVAIGGKKCQACKGKGWKGRSRPPCPDCHCNAMHVEPKLVDIGLQDRCGYEHPPGPLHGVSGHVWSALAVGLTYLDTLE